MAKPNLTAERLHQLFIYNADGSLTRRIQSGTSKSGSKAGYLDTHGYWKVNVDGHRYYSHRVIWTMHRGDIGFKHIDHIDGDKSNNRVENLRLADVWQNLHNAPMRRNNTSGKKGVYWNKNAGKWLAQLKVNGRHFYLGLFDNIEDASAEYEKARSSMVGEFVRKA